MNRWHWWGLIALIVAALFIWSLPIGLIASIIVIVGALYEVLIAE